VAEEMNVNKMSLLCMMLMACAEDPSFGASEKATVTISDDVIIDGMLTVGDRALIYAGLNVVAVGGGGNVVADGDIVAGVSGSLAGDLFHETVRSILIPGAAAVDPNNSSDGGFHTRLMSHTGSTIGYHLNGVTCSYCHQSARLTGSTCARSSALTPRAEILPSITYPFQIQSGDWIRGWRIHVVKNTPQDCRVTAVLARQNGTVNEEEILSTGVAVFPSGEQDLVPNPSVMPNALPHRVQSGFSYHLVVQPCGTPGDKTLGAEVDFNRSGP
jgi:hypothetical protein